MLAEELSECDFKSGFCGWTSVGENDKWKLSSNTTFAKYPGSRVCDERFNLLTGKNLLRNKYFLPSARFAYIDGLYKAQMESPALPWKPFHQSVGLCLRFDYVMPVKSRSYLKVFLRETKQGNPLSIWQLAGDHGEQWSAAQVALPGVKNVQVRTN